MRVRLILAVSLAWVTPVPAQSPGLVELAEIARARAARQRPALVEALKPFVADLSLAYRGRNQSYLDAKFDEIAKLGAGIVPLLLEYLTPTDAGEDAQNRSNNVARILARIDPTDHVDHLIELTRHTSETARRNAIWLLGFTASERAELALVDRIGALADPERIQIVESLARLGSRRGVSAAAELLVSTSLALRQHVLHYLTATDSEQLGMARVVAALANEPSDELLPDYVGYFKANPKRDAAAAKALAELAGKNRLGFIEQRDLIRAIGEVAPIGHRPSINALVAIIDATENAGELEIAAALALDALGERDGMKQVDRRLDLLVKRARDDDDALATRANWECARGEWRAAIRDYESAIKVSKSSSSRAMYYLQIARCEAHRGKWSRVRAALKNSGLGRSTIEREAASDPEFAQSLEKETVRKFLESLE